MHAEPHGAPAIVTDRPRKRNWKVRSTHAPANTHAHVALACEYSGFMSAILSLVSPRSLRAVQTTLSKLQGSETRVTRSKAQPSQDSIGSETQVRIDRPVLVHTHGRARAHTFTQQQLGPRFGVRKLIGGYAVHWPLRREPDGPDHPKTPVL
jgi:hypothetical protein